jgi:hypothetical protein
VPFSSAFSLFDTLVCLLALIIVESCVVAMFIIVLYIAISV